MTYHPGKVLKVIAPNDKNVKSSDNNVQATLEMWDENVFTFLVETSISKDVKEKDIVLVDYRPQEKIPVASQKIVKVLKAKLGKEVWDQYKDFHKKRKNSPTQMSMPQTPPSYMG